MSPARAGHSGEYLTQAEVLLVKFNPVSELAWIVHQVKVKKLVTGLSSATSWRQIAVHGSDEKTLVNSEVQLWATEIYTSNLKCSGTF